MNHSAHLPKDLRISAGFWFRLESRWNEVRGRTSAAAGECGGGGRRGGGGGGGAIRKCLTQFAARASSVESVAQPFRFICRGGGRTQSLIPAPEIR